ncbi:hypothetical protein [Methylobacter luteus]|nr:hypothetical protein [Methylobacter luteus]
MHERKDNIPHSEALIANGPPNKAAEPEIIIGYWTHLSESP